MSNSANLEEFTAYIQSNPNSYWKVQRRIAKNFLTFCSKDVENISGADIKDFLNFKVCHGMKPKSLKKLRIVLNRFSIYLGNSKKPEPFIPVDLETEYHNNTHLFKEKNLYDIRKAARKDLLSSAIIEVLYSTGLKVKEFVNLTNNDLDLENSVIYVRNVYQPRSISIAEDCKIAIEQYLRFDLNPSPTLFKYTDNGLRDMLRSLSKSANALYVTPSDFRIAFAWRLLISGMNFDKIQKILGVNALDSVYLKSLIHEH